MTDKSAEWDDDDLPGQWHEVGDGSPFTYHWQRGDGYPSIRIMQSGFLENAVEMYPDPREGKNDVLRTGHDSLDEAKERVLELMNEYPE